MIVEVFSDIACPWCYIGKRRLERALEDFPERDELEIAWRSYQLDPGAPAFGEPGAGGTTLEHLASKYGGGIEGARRMVERVSEVAAGDGLEYDLEHAARVNTLDGHRLTKAAAEHGAADAMVEALFRAQHVEALRVDDPDVLKALAADAGVPADAVAETLAGDAFAAAVQADIREAGQLGVQGVPFFAIDRRFAVSGAQPAELLGDALRRAWDERSPRERPLEQA